MPNDTSRPRSAAVNARGRPPDTDDRADGGASMRDETMFARTPPWRRLAWRLADALSLMAHTRPSPAVAPRFGDFDDLFEDSRPPALLPLTDPERRHALYEASGALEGEGPIEVGPLLRAIAALVEECRDVGARVHVAEYRRAEAVRNLANACRSLRQSVGFGDEVQFDSDEEVFARSLDRVDAFRALASAPPREAGPPVASADAVMTSDGEPPKNVWAHLLDEN